MGQKTNPIGLRLGINKTWFSNWFDEKNFSEKLEEDLLLRRYIRQRLQNAGVANVIIERTPKRIVLTVSTARPGIVIGQKGRNVEVLKNELKTLTSKEVQLNIVEIKRPELEAQLVADSIARQLEGRVSFRRAMKKALMATRRRGAEGIKITRAARHGGADMARREESQERRSPLHTLRADIDYATSVAKTTYGTIGVKVWICKGEILGKGQTSEFS